MDAEGQLKHLTQALDLTTDQQAQIKPILAARDQQRQQIFADQCAVCHGENLEGIRNPNLPQGGGPALIGGRGTLNTPKFKITVESYWPYASTLYDYILRAMPYTAPSSLKPDEVYSLVAYILGRGNIIDKKTVMDAKSLPKVQMPNRDGFVSRYPDKH